MNNHWNPRRRDERGQVLIIVAAGMVALIAMVALVIDGGYAWGQQRETQNGADAVAKAGTGVIQEMLGGAIVTDGDVGCAVSDSATDNNVTLVEAQYTDFQGNLLATNVGPCGSGAALPAGAQGVKAETEQVFDTFLAGVIGLNQLRADADATAVVAIAQDICPAAAGCAVLPVTFPRTIDTCDGTNSRIIGEGQWRILEPQNGEILDASNLSILPLCSTGPGSVGWLDYGCGNLANHINNPCNNEIILPTWLKTSTGNPNCCEDDLEQFTGVAPGVPEEEDAVVRIPLHDATCDKDDVSGSDPVEACPAWPDRWSGTGNNLAYHIPYGVGFKLDGAFTSGNDQECNEAPGNPPAGGNGATGCLKGWFVALLPSPGPLSIGDINPGDPVGTGVLLIN